MNGRWKGIEATVAGYHPGGAKNRPNGDVGITRVVGSTAPVYDVTEWTTGKISM